MKLSLIVLTSFYPAAQQALEYADTLGSAVGGRLVLLHAKRVSFFDPYLFSGPAWRKQELREEETIEVLLERQARELRSPATVEMATDLLPDMAQDLASRNQPALFVLGRPAPEQPGVDQLNPLAVELLRLVQLPVLLVPQGAATRVLPRRVIIAADDEAFTLADTHSAVPQLLRRLGAELTVVHVSALEDDDACTRALQAVQHSGLTAGLPEPTLRGYQAEGAEAGVLGAIRDTHADLVVVVARTRSYLGEMFHRSITAQIINKSPVPVLVVAAGAPTPAPASKEPGKEQPQAQSRADDILFWPPM